MQIVYFVLAISFGILLLVNLIWVISNIYMFVVNGIESIITGQTLIENIYYSKFLRWLILLDISWLVIGFAYVLKRKSYKTDSNLHYLQNTPIENHRICVIMPTFNEELSIKKVLEDFQNQKHVKQIIVIDNKSSDDTVKIARECGAKVIEKIENKGYSHSIVLGLNEALKTDANIITVTESDGTFNGYDLEKRMQAEDRAHRIGQKFSVTYVDIIAEETVDQKIVRSLRKKINIASEVMGEELRKWI